MPESIPIHRPGEQITCHAGVAITGARFVALTGEPVGGNPSVGAPAAGARTFGVAARDAAAGAKCSVMGLDGQIVPVEAAVALAAGNLVTPTATGAAGVAAVGNQISGSVVQGAAAGAQALVRLGYLGVA